MPRNVLLVGLDYTGPEISDANISVLGLCRSKIIEEKAARCLYDYDVIIINPASYSHFIFGKSTNHAESNKELWDLKEENDLYDFDTVFDKDEREKELSAAIKKGSIVIWLFVPEKKIHFFGSRSLYSGYVNSKIEKIISKSHIIEKKSKQVIFSEEYKPFKSYFKQLQTDGWTTCISNFGDKIDSKAKTPEGYCLGGEIKINNSKAWILTAPSTKDATNCLVRSAIEIDKEDICNYQYHGIFLCHNSKDKPFVRELKKSLEERGVERIWLDEVEIEIGDNLVTKIEEGIMKSKYFGIILSPNSIDSPWVKRELEMALNKEEYIKRVIILPLLYEKCELPLYLLNRLYADFTSEENYEAAIDNLLCRIKIK